MVNEQEGRTEGLGLTADSAAKCLVTLEVSLTTLRLTLSCGKWDFPSAFQGDGRLDDEAVEWKRDYFKESVGQSLPVSVICCAHFQVSGA